MKPKTNFDVYLEDQFGDEGFAIRLKKAAKVWDAAIHLPPFRRREKNPVNPVDLTKKRTAQQKTPDARRASLEE